MIKFSFFTNIHPILTYYLDSFESRTQHTRSVEYLKMMANYYRSFPHLNFISGRLQYNYLPPIFNSA